MAATDPTDSPDLGQWILAVDLGNGGPKVAAVTPTGDILATAFRPCDVDIGTDGAATQDARQWWTGLVEGIREIVQAANVAPTKLHAIGITGQWGSSVPVGADTQPVGPVLLWADTRARHHVADVIGGKISIQGIAPHKALPFVRITGGAPSPSGADPTGHSLLLQRDFPDVYAKTSVLLEPVDYVGLRFTGRAAATPASMILSWLTDNRLGAEPGYHPALVRRTLRDPHRLPELLATGSVLGPLLPDVAAELGLLPGAPVICGIPDLHAAVVGSGAVEPFGTHIVISTTAWIGTQVPFKRTDAPHSIATVPGFTADLPMVANNHETGGACLQWLRDEVLFLDDDLIPLRRPSYEALIATAAIVPAGCEGLLFMPWLNGERSPVEDKRLRGGFLNMTLRTDRAAMVRAVLEGVAFNARWLFDQYEKFLRTKVTSTRILGGGAQSDLWCQIHADILGIRVEQVDDPRNAQLRGVALYARTALGEITLAQTAELIPVAKVFVPNPANRAIYEQLYAEYRKLYPTVKGLYRRLNANLG
ncbi:MAG: FGGY-family carbohydrate kinase [Actinomycetes bacterium]